MALAVIINQLRNIEHELGAVHQLLKDLDHKHDLDMYADFSSSLTPALNSLNSSDPEMRREGVFHATKGLFKAEDYYSNRAEEEIARSSPAADELLATVSRAYVADARCYLEMEEIEVAAQRIAEGVAKLKPLYVRHIRALLTSNPAAYLHPTLANEIRLTRLAKIFDWLEPPTDEDSVFQNLRSGIFDFVAHSKEWRHSLPAAVSRQSGPSGGTVPSNQLLAMKLLPMFGGQGEVTVALKRLPSCLALMERMIEDFKRFEMYGVEIHAIGDFGLSFRKWRDLRVESGQEYSLLCISRSDQPGERLIAAAGRESAAKSST